MTRRRRPRTARAGRRRVPSHLWRWLRDRWRVGYERAPALFKITSWS
ncbi:hypothetical protein HCN51_31665 [Nonomuraea sp. FMUSA5-5]|uniref:Uncharacterized protein n=1 Tax=Nonomuraea composti TaxID=2720023 RepID=A0ABX1BGI3_9ACTN|nr:hypothetical protein [Nonomuraea sp. FMUSA5-5]NJP93943.1 hypothetical protein [Nonomuraea sp. FMUSA5-5]